MTATHAEAWWAQGARMQPSSTTELFTRASRTDQVSQHALIVAMLSGAARMLYEALLT